MTLSDIEKKAGELADILRRPDLATLNRETIPDVILICRMIEALAKDLSELRNQLAATPGNFLL